jgi:hypothetical protein
MVPRSIASSAKSAITTPRRGSDRKIAAIEDDIRKFDEAGKAAAIERQIQALDVDGKVAAIEQRITSLDADRRTQRMEGELHEAVKRLEKAIAAVRQ